MAASVILNSKEQEESKRIFKKMKLESDLEYGSVELSAIISQFDSRTKSSYDQNIPLTSSTGRIFDTVSYLLGVSNLKTYRGEPAMKLEGFASKGNPNNIDLEIKYYKKDGIYFINTSELVINILTLLDNPKINRNDIAAKFHVVFGEAFADIAIIVANLNKIDKIGLTGGVAYNLLFSNAVKDVVLKNGLKFLEHEKIPPGDAGISTGQLIGGLFKSTL